MPPPCDPDDLAVHLAGSLLEGRTVETTAVPGTDATVLWIRCTHDEVPAAWEAARAVVDRTGRWPVALWEVAPFPDQITSAYEPDRPTPFEIIDRSASIGAEEAAHYWRTSKHPVWLDLGQQDRSAVEHALRETAARVGDAPRLVDIADALGERFTDVQLEAWLNEWEAARSGPPSPDYLTWFEDSYSGFAISFTPVPDGPQASAFYAFYGAEREGEPERLVALLRRWEAAWGAELVASYTTMLQFVVRRPPRDRREAWEVALDHYTLAQCTTVLSGISIREHAHELVGRETWFLHERP